MKSQAQSAPRERLDPARDRLPSSGEVPFLRIVTADADSPLTASEDPAGAGAHVRAEDNAGAGVAPANEPEAALRDELERMNTALESATPEAILRWGTERFGDRLTMATAFGPEGMVIVEILSRVAPRTHIFNLDTGYQFAETLELRERVRQRYGMEIELARAEQTVEEYERSHGGPMYQVDPNQCCHDRKIVVLRRAITGKVAWITAIRRDQSPDRAQAPIVGWDRKFGLVKINPLANWSKSLVWKHITDHDVPYNPLHDQGYTSIGCWPCTRAVLLGEDERAGRWSGTAKTECGLHSLG